MKTISTLWRVVSGATYRSWLKVTVVLDICVDSGDIHARLTVSGDLLFKKGVDSGVQGATI